MDLKTFVKNSIRQIAEGINEAIVEAAETGVYINPSQDGKSAAKTKLSFSLNVTTTKEGGADLKILSGSIGQECANRIDFDIEVVLPGMRRPLKPMPDRSDYTQR